MTDMYESTTNMYGGYVKDSLLRTNDSGLRTFTQVMDDGSTRGSFSYKDRRDPKLKAYRTPWMPIAHKIFTEKCTSHKDKTGIEDCPPMIIRVRETTLGNNKFNLGKRQRQYYVTQEFYDEPRRIGKILYTYEPKSWFMKWNETPEAFFTRMYSKRDGKRRHLPPIPDVYKDKIEAKIKTSARGRGKVTISDDVPITAPPPKKGRVKRTTLKEMGETKKAKQIAQKPGLGFLAAQGEDIVYDGHNEPDVPSPTGRAGITPSVSRSGRTPKTVPTKGKGRATEEVTPRTAPAKLKPSTPKASTKTPKIATSSRTPSAVEGPTEGTLVLTLDNEPYDTGISTDLPDNQILDQILVQEFPGDAEILATILNMAREIKGWDYSDVIDEQPTLLRIDPEGNTLNGDAMITIIDGLKAPTESVIDFLQSLDVHSYAGPGTYTLLAEEGNVEDDGSQEFEGEEEEEFDEGEEGSEDSDDENARFAGEAGQDYLSGVLSRLNR